jgi:SAM-dependent methyltransferase
MKTGSTKIQKDYWWLNLRDLPYFRAFIRTVEAGFYENFHFTSPILDLGCGDGHFSKVAFDFKIDVGVDPWGSPIHEAGKTNSYKSLVQSDGVRLPFPDGYFGSGFSNSALEHIPQIQSVLIELNRVLKPGALFVFCVPNSNYLNQLDIPQKMNWLGLMKIGNVYTKWFKRISRVHHAENVEVWQKWIGAAGFSLEKTWNYFSPEDMRILEWGHYFGFPSLLIHLVFGKWILIPHHWNLFLIENSLRHRTLSKEDSCGTFSFFIVKKP